MELRPDDLEFLRTEHAAAMITVGSDGRPKVARVGVAMVGDRLWSSGTSHRVRTRRLREDPRCTLYVHAANPAYLALETTVTILDGTTAVEGNVALFRIMQQRPTGPLWWYGEELEEDAFRRRMVDEDRLIYDFDVQRCYGPHL